MTKGEARHRRDEVYVRRIASQYKHRYAWADLQELELTGALAAAHVAYRAALERSMEAVGVGRTIGRSTLLRALYFAEGKPLSQNEIGKQLAVTPATVTYMLTGLEKEGLVTRVRMEEDRRAFQVALTAPGREMAERLLPMIPRLSVDLWRDFSTEDREKLLDLLLRFVESTLTYNSRPAALAVKDGEPERT
jgi:MarR family transcriptional regulator for hemolysin